MKKATTLIACLLACLAFISCDPKENSVGISIVGSSEYTLSAEAVNLVISISTDASSWNYEVKCSGDWINPSSKKTSSATFYIATNRSYDSREAEIVFYAPDSSAPGATTSVTVTQKGQVKDPELTLSSTKIEIPYTGGKQSVEISTTFDDWGFEAEPCDWLTLGASESSLVIDAAVNTVDAERFASIAVFSSLEGRELKAEISVVQAPADIDYGVGNLSENGSSNSYIITHRGDFTFDARVRGNGAVTDGLDAPQPLSPSSAELLWQDAKGMITAVSLSDGTVHFTASRTCGNAVIAAKDGNGEIIWSWHIWHPSEEVAALQSSRGFIAMSMNLGAMNSEIGLESYGLLYQWGRKDPFPGSPIAEKGSIATKNIPVYDINGNEVSIEASSQYSSSSNTLAYSISHPTTCLSNGSTGGYDWLVRSESSVALWGNPKGDIHTGGEYLNNGEKSFYDPCPPGWRVPPLDFFAEFTASGQYAWVSPNSDGSIPTDTFGNMLVYYVWGSDSFNVYDVNGDGCITMDDYICGWTFNLDAANGVHSYFPATTRYDGQYAMLMGSMVGLWGNYWTNAPTIDQSTYEDQYTSTAMTFGITDYNKNTLITVSPCANGGRANAFAVRCIKEQSK